MIELANWLAGLIAAYVVAGLLFGIPFVFRGVDRIDSVARDGTRGFRLIILPGVIALWPLLVVRWIGGKRPPRERNAHRDAATP